MGRARRLGPVAAIVTVAVIGTGAAAIWLVPREPGAGPVPAFVDETAASGIGFTYDGAFEYAVGAGVAAFDCDDDGRQDLYLAGGAGPAALFHNDSAAGGALRFSRRPDPATDLEAVNGAYPIDIDGDGVVDLMTLRLGENVALRGLGGCRFERANERWTLDGGGENTEAFSATWEHESGPPTLAFGNYLEPGNLEPDTRCQANVLVRPLPRGGSGSGAYDTPVRLAPSFCALSVLFSDWSGTGRRDLRVSNDRAYYRQELGSEQLWRIVPGEEPRLYTAADGWSTVKVEGMGIGSFDLTGDGLPEVYLTSQAASKLQTLGGEPGRPTYVDIGLARGVNVAHPFMGDDMDLPSTAWHPAFGDVNNDGLIDLFVSKGNVAEQPDYAMQDPSNLLLGQPDGTFLEAADRAGIAVFDRGRGAALVDLNRDGRLDLVESFYGSPVRVWRNAGPVEGSDAGRAHWLGLRLHQDGPNADAIGAVIEIRSGAWRQTRELVIGGGHAGGQLGWLHVGVGPRSSAEVRVRWPDGVLGAWEPVALDAFSVVQRTVGPAASLSP
jgi:hypothetical protein